MKKQKQAEELEKIIQLEKEEETAAALTKASKENRQYLKNLVKGNTI